VELVDEHDGAAFLLGEFLKHGLKPFLEFSTVLGTGQ
jgi:hypothetical protein